VLSVYGRRSKEMKTKMHRLILAVTAVFLFTAAVAVARFPGLHDSSGKSADIDLTGTTTVPNGPTLKAGNYRVTLLNGSSTPELGFYQDGKLVGQAPVKLVDQEKKISETQVFSDTKDDHTQVLTEMDLRGWTQKVMFSGSDATSGSGK
jgi:hypothetical protein